MRPAPKTIRPLRLALSLYKKTLSPLLAALTGGGCRYTPTCSEYAVQAVEEHGFLNGSWLATKRICRCQPWGGMGYDPVPLKFPAEATAHISSPLSPDKTSTAHHCEHC